MVLRIAIDGRALTDQNPGLGRYLWNLARALPQVAGEGEEIHLLTGPEEENTRFPLAELDALGVTRVPVRQALDSRRQKRALPRLLAEIGAKVFHASHERVAFRPPCPLVVTVYDALDAADPASRKGSKAVRQTLDSAARILALSQVGRKDLLGLGIEPRRLAVTAGAPDPDLEKAPPPARREVRKRLRLPGRYVLNLGTAKPHKNLVRLVEAWAEVKRADIGRGELWQLVLAGTHDPAHGEARAKARELDLAEVRFLGPVAETDLAAVLSGAQIFVLPSLAEGSGLPLLEAMACGTAVACSRTTALPAVAGAGAAYFDPEDKRMIAATLVRLMKNPGYRQMLAERGTERAEQLSWEGTARATLKVYRKVAAEAG